MDIWEEIYKKRKKIVGSKKAKYSADAIYKSFLIKEFLKKEGMKNKILKEWTKEKIEVIMEKENNYPIYKIEDENIIITPDKKVLKDYKNEERKGKIGLISDEYDREIIFKVVKENDLKIQPNEYYVIYKG